MWLRARDICVLRAIDVLLQHKVYFLIQLFDDSPAISLYLLIPMLSLLAYPDADYPDADLD